MRCSTGRPWRPGSGDFLLEADHTREWCSSIGQRSSRDRRWFFGDQF